MLVGFKESLDRTQHEYNKDVNRLSQTFQPHHIPNRTLKARKYPAVQTLPNRIRNSPSYITPHYIIMHQNIGIRSSIKAYIQQDNQRKANVYADDRQKPETDKQHKKHDQVAWFYYYYRGVDRTLENDAKHFKNLFCKQRY
jgi:hypothetical protein